MRVQDRFNTRTAEAIKVEVEGIGAEVLYEIQEMRKEAPYKDPHSQKALLELELRIWEKFEENKKRLSL
jgi:hypothetical protein